MTFKETPIMSTYLLAFVVGDFRFVGNTTTSVHGKVSKPVRVYAVPGKEHQGEFAVSVAGRALEWYEEFFDYDVRLWHRLARIGGSACPLIRGGST